MRKENKDKIEYDKILVLIVPHAYRACQTPSPSKDESPNLRAEMGEMQPSSQLSN